jgi:hypothetical protein
MACVPPPGGSGKFTATLGTMSSARAAHAADITGQAANAPALVAGGIALGGSNVVLNSAELFNPDTVKFIATRPDNTTPITMNHNRALFTATFIPSINRVLVAGGTTLVDSSGAPLLFTSSAELFNPITRTFADTRNTMTTARSGHTATLLPDGTVLITGGLLASNLISDTAEIFDPRTGLFIPLVAKMSNARVYHTASLMAAGPQAGRVLIAGGVGGNAVLNNSADIYDPAAHIFIPVPGGMHETRQFHAASALVDGRVLITGGFITLPDIALFVPTVSTNSAEIFVPGATAALSHFVFTNNNMSSARAEHTSTLLPNIQVLVAGGVGTDSPMLVAQTADLFNPATNRFTATGMMTTPRDLHTATLLNCGTPLLTGGILNVPSVGQNTAELYHQ